MTSIWNVFSPKRPKYAYVFTGAPNTTVQAVDVHCQYSGKEAKKSLNFPKSNKNFTTPCFFLNFIFPKFKFSEKLLHKNAIKKRFCTLPPGQKFVCTMYCHHGLAPLMTKCGGHFGPCKAHQLLLNLADELRTKFFFVKTGKL